MVLIVDLYERRKGMCPEDDRLWIWIRLENLRDDSRQLRLQELLEKNNFLLNTHLLCHLFCLCRLKENRKVNDLL